MNVVEPILHFGRTRADAPALVEDERTISYGELAQSVRRMAGHLLAEGLKPGDRVGLCLKDTAEHVVALLALGWLGATAVPLDWRARPGETASLVADLGLAAALVEADGDAPGAGRLILLDEGWREAAARAEPCEVPSAGGSEPFVISATSGSTGAPKFTVMTHLQYYFAIVGMWELMGLAGRHRFLCTMPLYYSGGRNSCIAHLLRGDCVVLHPSLFSPAEYVALVERHQITVGGLVPSTVRQLLALEGDEPLLPGLALLFSTGAPLYALEKQRATLKLSANFHERYGTAETMAISTLRPADFADRPESVGQPHSLAQVEIVDDEDRPVPIGESGRLRFRGPGLGSPLGAAAEASFRGGWYVPGEIARLDEAGYIFLEGRVSDVIMRSVVKIYPAEVEAALAEHPKVAEAAVIGGLGLDNEETVIAFVVRSGDASAGELLAHCRARLSPHKAPRTFYFVEQLPRNTAGKVDKKALAASLKVQSDQ